MNNINASNMSDVVRKVFNDCLFKEEDNVMDIMKVEGLRTSFKFNKRRVEKWRETVSRLLDELPLEYGEGFCFLDKWCNKDGELWAREKEDCEHLMVIAVALEIMLYCLPKEYWGILPNGVPYVIIK